MKLLKDKKVVMIVLSIILVLVVMSSTTYALFFKVHTMENTESYTAGILEITVEEGTALTLNNTLPMTDEEGASLTPYTFKVTNTGNLAYTFDLKILSTTSNNQINPAYIKVKLDDNSPVVLSSLSNGLIADDLTLNPEESITMSVRIWLSINTPNTEIGKNFSAKIVTDGVGSEYVPPALDTLTKLGLSVSDGTPDFNKMAQASCSDESECETTNGIYAAEDDLGTSYYFRGAVENNYVYFAGYYWRIIRINGDGTIRMIYDGTSAHANGESSSDRQLGTTAFNTDPNDNAYVGYMYGTAGSGTYEDTHANTNNSTIKTANDNWYKTNIVDKNYSQYVADAIYCNDRSLSSGTGIGTTETYYMAYNRLYTNKTPSLKCTQTNDKFTTSSSLGNGVLTYPVGLITADELSFAGVSPRGKSNLSYYLYSGQHYWTISPSLFSAGGSWVYRVTFNSYLQENFVFGSLALRPVISLKSDTEFSGDGTMSSPFKIVS